ARAIEALAAGGEFSVFVAATGNEWQRLAAWTVAHSGYSVLDLDDIVQTMLISVWETIGRWEPDRGPLARFVLWNTLRSARKATNRAKGIERSSPLEATGRDEPTFEFDYVVDEDVMSPEEVIGKVEVAREYLRHATSRDRVLV